MGSTKHEKSFVDFDKTYEQNIIGMRGIIYFGIGLLTLIVVTFGLMYALLNVMTDQARDSKQSNNPLMMNEKERLPPEPRLQAAPGFGVDTNQGRVNLELRAPQSEWWVRREEYKEIWENGQKVVDASGKETIVTLPIDQAKERLLGEADKNAAGGGTSPAPNAAEIVDQSRQLYSESSAGRIAPDRRRY